MPDSVSFTVHAIPHGKSRHQTLVTLRCGQCQRLIMGQRKECPHCLNRQLYFSHSSEYTPKEQKECENFIAMCAQQGMLGRKKFEGPTRVECRFFFGIPKSRIKKLKEGDPHTQRPDVDNCKKTVLDSCLGVCYVDDCVITQIWATKEWTFGCPRTEVKIESVGRSDQASVPHNWEHLESGETLGDVRAVGSRETEETGS